MSLPLPKIVTELEKEIIDELEREKLSVYFKIIKFNPKAGGIRGLEYNLECIGEILENRIECNKVKEKARKIIDKHYDAWLKKHKLE